MISIIHRARSPRASLLGIIATLSLHVIVPARAAEPWVAPSGAAAMTNPQAGDSSLIDEGRKLYQSTCVACHGASGSGNGPAAAALAVKPRNLRDPGIRDQSDGSLFWKVSKGRSPMPGFEAAYSEKERWAIISYLRSLSGPANAASTATVARSSSASRPGAGAAQPGPAQQGPVSRSEYNRLQHELLTMKAQMTALLEKTGIDPSEIPAPQALPADSMADSTTTEIEAAPAGELFSGSIIEQPWNPALTKFLLTGYAEARYTDIQGQNSTFGANFNPIFLWKQGDRLLFEGELEITVEESETQVELEYAQITYLLNDFMTIGVGKFLSPTNYFQERLHPAWINKLPDAPVALGHDGLLAPSQLGAQVRGGLSVGPVKFAYAAYVSNGPTLRVELDGAGEGEEHAEEEGEEPAEMDGGHAEEENRGHAETGTLDFDNFDDLNGNKAYGARIAILPFPQLEIGYGFEFANVTPPVGSFGDINALSHIVDANYVRDSEWLRGVIDVRAQIVWLEVDNPGVAPLDFNNDRSGGYVQLAYRPSKLGVPILSDLEVVGRYGWLDRPSEAPENADVERWTIGLNYWAGPSTVLKVSYQFGEERGPHEITSFDGFTVEAAMGF